MTVTTSGWPRKISRMRLTYLLDCSSEIEIGRVARTQRLPSSSLGMNSLPSEP